MISWVPHQDCSFLVVQIFHKCKSYQHKMKKGLFLLHPPSSCAAFYPFGSKSLLKVLVLMVLALLGLWGAITAALSNTAALQRTSSQPGGPLIPLETPISNPCENWCTTLELLWTQKKRQVIMRESHHKNSILDNSGTHSFQSIKHSNQIPTTPHLPIPPQAPLLRTATIHF